MPESEVIENLVPRIKTKDQTPAFKIWNYRFICLVNQMHMYDKKYLSQFGFTDSGNANINREMARSPQHVQLSVAAMAELHHDGVDIVLTVPEDSVKIYQMIYDHLMDWQVRIRENTFITAAPIEDLRKLDELAGEIYKIAKFYWKNKPYHGGFFQFLDTQSRAAIHRRAPLQTPGKEKPSATDTHKPMVDSIGADLSRRNVKWR